MKKICVVTGSRAEYGLLRWVMHQINEDAAFELQIIATGTHLSSEFGLTYQEIERDGFVVNRKIEMLTNSDTCVGVTKSIGLGLIGFADAISHLKPNLVVVLGDRFEIFSAATAAYVANVPIAHIHGGETTFGSLDEAFRHSITKMANYHFVATSEYRNRVIQLGEQPDKVYVVGGLGIDSILNTQLLGKAELEEALGIKFSRKNLLITFHPDTSGASESVQQMNELLHALDELSDATLIFTAPNADVDGSRLMYMLSNYVEQSNNAYLFKSMGQLNYLSCMSVVDGVIGNSSSGLIEAPHFRCGTVNIGDRQNGRQQAASIINCAPTAPSISNALDILYSDEFSKKLKQVINPYGTGGAGKKILKVLKESDINRCTRKKFHDLRIDNNGDISNECVET